MTDIPGQGPITCLNCGNQTPAGASFCPACGRVVSTVQGPSSISPVTPVPAPAPTTAPPVAPTPPPGPPAGYGLPPTTQQLQGPGPVPGYPAGFGYAPTPARRNSTPIFVALGLIGLLVVIIAGAVFLSSAGGPHAKSAPSAIALATPTGGTTRTSVPSPTSAPTQTPIPASNDAITVDDFTITITGVTLSDGGMSGYVPAGMTSDQTVLGVEATLVSGGTLTDLSSIPVWATDETGDRYDVGAALSVDSGNGAIWMYAVPRTSSVFLWWFPSGEVIDLTPLLSTSPSVTPVPTAVPTPEGTPWEVFNAHETVQHATQITNTEAWNEAKNPSTTYAAATRARADAQADLVWLNAHQPIECYSDLYDDLILYDNQEIKTMNDWFAGRYATVNDVDVPAVNATWNRIDGELADAEAVCS
jgi:hypothetical protein